MDRSRSALGGAAAVFATAGVAALAAWAFGCGGEDFDRRIAAPRGGALAVDVALGSGVSFDHGSLEITTHARDEVLVRADVSGWGGYAVDLDVTEHAGELRVVCRVEGALHWLFGGPTVDVRVVAPESYPIDARIDGGDLRLEDVSGALHAAAVDTDVALLRADGDVHLESGGGRIRADDVEGALQVDDTDGEVEISGVGGAVRVRTGRGEVAIASVTGTVDVETGRGDVELERVRGDVRIVSERGRIRVDDVAGELDVATGRGRIEIAGLSGPVRARSERGSVEVRFAGPPAGEIRTVRGSIRVLVPPIGGFGVDADTRRGHVEIADTLAFAPRESPQLASGPTAAERVEALQQLGERVADEVRARVEQRVAEMRRRWEQHREGSESWSPQQEWEHWKPGERPWPWDAADWRWPDADWGDAASTWAWPGRRGEQRVGDVNGGGADLLLRSDRGSIRIDPL